MSPQSFCCWLADRRWAWCLWPRLRPEPDRNFPWRAVGVATVLGAFLAAMAIAVLLAVVASGPSEQPLPGSFQTVSWMAAEFGALAGFWLGIFTLVAWNQRAARLRAGVIAGPTSPGWAGLLVLGPIYALVLGLIAPICLFVGAENIRGALRWRSVRSELLARGEKLRIEELAPAPAPADGNLGALPEFAALFDYGPQKGDASRWKNPEAMQPFAMLRLPESQLPKRGTATVRSETSLADWAEAFRSTKEKQDAGKGPTLSLPVYGPIPAGADPATAILSALAVAGTDLGRLKDAATRPRAVFGIHWSEGFEALLPHLREMKKANMVLELRSKARLAHGDAVAAWDDALGAVRLADVLREEPLLISQLVRFAQMNLAARTVRNGIIAHAWTESQLAELQRAVDPWRPAAGLPAAVRGERAIAGMGFDRWTSNRRPLAEDANVLAAGNSGDERPGANFSAYVIPSGWLRDAQATLALYGQAVIDALRPAVAQMPADGLGPVRNQVESIARGYRQGSVWNRPGNLFVAMLAPGYGNVVTKAFKAEQVARSTAVACALERHRIARGAYPETLAALVPVFLPTLPLDVMDGKPMRYARTPEGGFRLWSVGPNGRDDGGIGADPRTNEPLDWVWP